jgi:hypothetical protein
MDSSRRAEIVLVCTLAATAFVWLLMGRGRVTTRDFEEEYDDLERLTEAALLHESARSGLLQYIRHEREARLSS